MINSLLTLLAIAAPQPLAPPSSSLSTPSVVINEFLYDDALPNADLLEFVELENTSSVTVDISGWVVECRTPAGLHGRYVVDQRVILVPSARWTMGGVSTQANQVFPGTDLFANGTAALTLRDLQGSVVDTVAYETVRGIWDPSLAEGTGLRQDVRSDASWQRVPNGVDTNDNARDFRLMPSSIRNPNSSNPRLPFTSIYSGRIADPVTAFLGGDQPMRVIDPSLAMWNPSGIPASPTGGNAAIAWNALAGNQGNTTYLKTSGASRLLIDTCFYFDARLLEAGEWECSVIGLRGYGGSTAHPPDPIGDIPAYTGRTWQPDYTGVAAVWQRTATRNDVWLVDFGRTGRARVVGKIPVKRTGWARLALQAGDDDATLVVGTDEVSGVVEITTGGAYVSYRGKVGDPSRRRPPTLDDTVIDRPRPRVRTFGYAVENSRSPLRLVFSGEPAIGEATEFIGMGVLPQVPATFAFGPRRSQPLMFGRAATPGAALWVDPVVFSGHVPTSAEVRQPISIPNDTRFVGRTIATQIFQLDPSLPYQIPLTHSPGVELFVGR